MKNAVVRSGALTGYRRLVRSLGGDPLALLADAGLRPGELDDPDRYLSYAAVAAAIEAPADRLGIPDFGMRLAGYQDISAIGPLAFALQNAGSAYEGMTLTAESIAFQSPAIRLAIQPDPKPGLDRVIFDIATDWVAGPQTIEHAIGVMNSALQGMTGGSLVPQSVALRHAPVSPPALYRRHLGVVPRFGATWNGLRVPGTAFRRRLPQRSRLLGEYARRFAALRAPADHLPADQKTLEVLRNLMRSRPATLAEAARVMALHPRTLQQRLAAVGTSFEALRDQVRRELADTYLVQKAIPLAHVASLLGYSEQAVLSRSCQRWFGCPPSARRRALGSG